MLDIAALEPLRSVFCKELLFSADFPVSASDFCFFESDVLPVDIFRGGGLSDPLSEEVVLIGLLGLFWFAVWVGEVSGAFETLVFETLWSRSFLNGSTRGVSFLSDGLFGLGDDKGMKLEAAMDALAVSNRVLGES
jgi:hypothetical protein